MDKSIAISSVEVTYSEKTWKIFVYDLAAPAVITAGFYWASWKYAGPLLFEKVYQDYNLATNPRFYYPVKEFCYGYVPYAGLALGFLVFGVLSYQLEFIPGPGRLLVNFLRRFKKRTELTIKKEFEDLSHPKTYDFKAPDSVQFMKQLQGELKPTKDKPWNEPWSIDRNSICIGFLNPFETSKKSRFRNVVLETAGRNLHTAIIGASGSGKTVSYIGPTLAMDSLNPTIGTFTINPKGDLKLKRFAFAGIHQHFKKTGEFLNKIQVLSFSDKKHSLMYDPFLFGSEISSSLDIQNKICGSMVFVNEFYKTVAYNFVGKFAAIMADEPKLRYRLTLRHLVYYLGNPQAIAYLEQYIEKATNKENLNFLKNTDIKNLIGIQSHLSTFVDNADLAHIFDDFGRPCLNLISTLQDSGNVFIEVDTISKGAVSKSAGKMLIRDLQVLASKRDCEDLPRDNLISVNLDEFGSFAYPEFIDFLDKARSSGFLITLAFQDLANLEKEGLPRSFKNEVLANTSNKFFFKLADNVVSEYASEFLGSRYAITETQSYSSSAATLSDAQQGSTGIRHQKELLPFVLPTQLQTLNKGQCYIKIATDKYGPVAGAATIGLFPEDGMPSSEEVFKYMRMSFDASLKHPGRDKLLPITNEYDPYANLRNNRIQDPILASGSAPSAGSLASPVSDESGSEAGFEDQVNGVGESDFSQPELDQEQKQRDDVDDLLSGFVKSSDDDL